MSWPVELIEDHADEALARLVSQYKGEINFAALINVFASRTQALEQPLYNLLTRRWIDDGEGQQLDELGLILGEPRAGKTDVEYRVALRNRAILNAASGEYDPIPLLASTLTEAAGFVSIEEDFPAKLIINMTGDLDVDSAQRLREAIGAGIGLDVVLLDRFGVDGIGSETPATGAGGFTELDVDTGERTGGARIRELLFID